MYFDQRSSKDWAADGETSADRARRATDRAGREVLECSVVMVVDVEKIEEKERRKEGDCIDYLLVPRVGKIGFLREKFFDFRAIPLVGSCAAKVPVL
jgi:hypothetical protein